MLPAMRPLKCIKVDSGHVRHELGNIPPNNEYFRTVTSV